MTEGTKVEGLALSRWERLAAGVAMIGCLFGIIDGGTWRWVALPCLAFLFVLAWRRTGRAEEALARSEKDFRSLVDLPVQATFVADGRGALLHISRRWEEWTGLDFATTSRRNWVEAMHPEDRQRCVDAWAGGLISGEAYDQTLRLRMRDGGYRWFRSRAFAQRDEAGQITRWTGAVEDIHDRRIAEEQLRQTAGLLEMIGSSTDSIIYAKDRQGRMLYCNRALEQLAGISMADILGKTDTEWNPNLAEAEALQAADRIVLATGETQDVEEAFTGRDGRTRHYQTLKSPLTDPSGEIIGVVGVSTDISAAREAEQREKLLARELDHRAKNLLAVVQSVVTLTRAATLPEFRTAIEGRIHALGRAHSMLAASRWEGADLERLLTEELAPYRGGEQAQVHLFGPPTTLKPAAAQSLALVIHELATNAVKYGALSVPDGSLHVSWELSDSVQCEPMLVLRWEEQGGPPVAPRGAGSRTGFGSRVIRSSIERQLGGTLRMDWAESGLVVTMEVALDRSIRESRDPAGDAQAGTKSAA